MHKFASNIQKLIFSYLLTFDSWSFLDDIFEQTKKSSILLNDFVSICSISSNRYVVGADGRNRTGTVYSTAGF